MEVSTDLKRDLKSAFGDIVKIEWNQRRMLFEVFEKRRRGAIDVWEHIFDYANVDGSRLPISREHLFETLNYSDVKKFPMKQRVAVMRKERELFREKISKDFRERIEADVKDDLPYFTSQSRFFMNPESMPEWKSKFRPSQERILRERGQL